MAFKAQGANTYKTRVTLEDRRTAILSTGTEDANLAAAVEAMVAEFRRKRRWNVLELLVTKKLKLKECFDAEENGQLEDKIIELTDIDIEPLVAEWASRVTDPKYVYQVRGLIPKGARFPAAHFRRKVISKYLAELDCADPTRNRYRAGCSSFGEFLVEREILETNPVRDVKCRKERDPRMVWMPWAQSVMVADCAVEPFRTLAIIMAGTGIELGAALSLVRSDVNFEEGTIWAHGTKKAWRDRVVRYEPFVEESLDAVCRDLVGAAPLFFPGVDDETVMKKRQDAALRQWRNAQAASKVVAGHTLHDLRHTYAVNGLKKGYKPQVIAHQLGHKDTTQVIKCYGRYVPSAEDYQVANGLQHATNLATSINAARQVKVVR